MKVIQIMDNVGAGGGVNSFVYDLCYALKEQGCDVSLIGILKKGYEENPEIEKLRAKGIRVECVGAINKKDAIIYCIGKLKTLIRDIADGDAAICNLHLKLSVLMGVLATRGLKNVQCVETYHSQYSNYWLQTKVLSPFISMYIACSISAKEEFIKRFHPNKNKVVAISNGVDMEKLRAQVTEKKKNESITAISVGRFTNQKNLHVTAEAFSKIEERGFVYKIFGDGDLKQRIEDAAGHSDTVKLCGLVPRQTIINELAGSDIVVMPSLWEGLSIFMLEAMALGCPMMISDAPSLRGVFDEEPLKNGEAWRKCPWGYLVETSNVTAYKDAMLDFLNSKSNKEIMSRNVTNYAKKFDINETAAQYVSVYEDI